MKSRREAAFLLIDTRARSWLFLYFVTQKMRIESDQIAAI
jgi:hypothetical protein